MFSSHVLNNLNNIPPRTTHRPHFCFNKGELRKTNLPGKIRKLQLADPGRKRKTCIKCFPLYRLLLFAVCLHCVKNESFAHQFTEFLWNVFNLFSKGSGVKHV
uniref:Uncharacterized protein n=1 Tax=Cacopsylla melanoneura TaxID=428564 RepID=A0A8D8MF91_9HEMI